jgi:two-component system sensor histidine kinase ChiS
MKKKVLFIDDDPTILLISKLMLEDLGYDVLTAEGGLIGIEILKKSNNIDLILLDLMMPDIYGIDVLKWIKKDQKFKHIPVILQTGVQISNDIMVWIQAREFSNVHVLLKPYDKEDLKDLLKEL